MVNWIPIKDAMPTPYRNVLVMGGVAYWDGSDWYTCMERNHPKIQWNVDYWALLPKPPDCCSGCDALRAELTELTALIDAELVRMNMIDIDEYREKLEARFLAADFAKLNEPVDTEDVFYTGMIVDETLNFDMGYWNPAVLCLLGAMTEAGINEFYRLDVYYTNDTLWVTASLGDSNGQQS